MNELLKAMSTDMRIKRYQNETEDSFAYRLCYSALGQWCLRLAQNTYDGAIGTSKHSQTIILNELIARFIELFPYLEEKLIDGSGKNDSISVHIRKVYEETGYLLTSDTNRNRIANYGRSIAVGHANLFFGLPSSSYTVNGLGVLTPSPAHNVTSREFLIRDNLSWKKYFQAQFDNVEFGDRDIDITQLEFFDPQSHKSPSSSWRKSITTSCTIARGGEFGPFYKVKQMTNGSFLFADEPIITQSDAFTSYEYRRLYFALKAQYGAPLIAYISRHDSDYATVRLSGLLPNREYYYILLLAWPQNTFYNKAGFIIRTDLLPELSTVLINLGIKIESEGAYA